MNDVVPPGELLAARGRIVAKMIANSPIAVRFALEAVHRGFALTLAAGLLQEATLFAVSAPPKT